MSHSREVTMQRIHQDHAPVPRERLVYRLIFATSFLIFLAVGAVQRLMPWQWRLPARAAGRRGLFAEASRAAGTVTPFAFMG
jgi:hypothetical protein